MGCLASYNNGMLHGKYISVHCDEDEFMSKVSSMLKKSKISGAEEWDIFDIDSSVSIDHSDKFSIENMFSLIFNIVLTTVNYLYIITL